MMEGGGEARAKGAAYSLLPHGRQLFNPIKEEGKLDSLIGICLVEW